MAPLNYNKKTLTEIIIRLQNKDLLALEKNYPSDITFIPNPNAYPTHLSLEEATSLKINDVVDHRDHTGKYILATIVDKNGSNLKIHYIFWSRKWDIWSDYSKELHRFALPKSISSRSAHKWKNLEVGLFVDVNPIIRHPGWKIGEIRRIDHKSGQVQVIYNCNSR